MIAFPTLKEEAEWAWSLLPSILNEDIFIGSDQVLVAREFLHRFYHFTLDIHHVSCSKGHRAKVVNKGSQY